MSTQQVQSKTDQVPQQQQQHLGKEDVKSKGKTEATESVSSQQQQEQKVELRGKQYPKSHLEEKDIQCMLKMSDGLTQEQKHVLGNMFVEFADISSPDEIKNKLPNWPLEKPWYSLGHVPMQEKRTFRFLALLPIFRDHILSFDVFKDFNGSIGQIDYNTLISEKTETMVLKKNVTEKK